ncbi:hypothetical protein CDL15_Pgr010986 [Punica granatum]|uniref:Phosphoglycolate phosphatase 1B, chloroplastic-like n=1 Tax=Punica granatum TaxID=22663 RepID=A0A218XPG2_PUNGR|nr:hypothetical protein CDL15_Pgr010986 [Punica granatum]
MLSSRATAAAAAAISVPTVATLRGRPSSSLFSPFLSSPGRRLSGGGANVCFGRRRSSSSNNRMRSGGIIASAAQPLQDPDQLIDSVETFIFDCDEEWNHSSRIEFSLVDGAPTPCHKDGKLRLMIGRFQCNSFVTNHITCFLPGVIWKGDKLIDGVPETLDMLRSKGKRLVFVTNNSTKSRKQYGKKFETLGLNVNEEEIFASSFAAAAYLKSINFPRDKKEDGGKKIELKPGFLMEHDKDVGAVVVGFDRYFNYYKVQYGTLCIRENPGCLFIATNRDAVTHLTDAQEWAGGGSMVGALLGSTQREPLVVGKPSTFMMDYLADKFGITKSQICMVGDRLDTDILFGQNGGCKTLLVLSGVTSLPMLQNPNNSIQPDFYTNKISDFLSLKAATV